MLSFRQPRSRDDLALHERSSVGGQATPRSGGHSKHPFAYVDHWVGGWAFFQRLIALLCA